MTMTYEQFMMLTDIGDFRMIHHKQRLVRWAPARLDPNAIYFYERSWGIVREIRFAGVHLELDLSQFPNGARDQFVKDWQRTIVLPYANVLEVI